MKNLLLSVIAFGALIGSNLVSAHTLDTGHRDYRDRGPAAEYYWRDRHDRYDQRGPGRRGYGRVVDVDPIVKVVRIPYTRRECGHDHRPWRDLRGNARNIRSDGRYWGDDHRGEHRRYDRDDHRRCRTVTDYRKEHRTVGYKVTYRYRGRIYTVRTSDHPGRWIRVRD